MNLGHLFESETTDEFARSQAVLAYDQIKQWLTGRLDVLPRGLAPANGNFKGGYTLRASDIGLTEYPDLYVAFLPTTTRALGSATGSLGQNGQGNWIIFVRCMIEPGDCRFLNTRFPKTVFVHEFMHYLMRKRRNNDSSGSHESLQSGDMRAYFNNPDETNAYYQEAVTQWLNVCKTVREMSPSTAQEWEHESTAQLIARAKKGFFDRDFLDNASPKTMRALDKRLARFIELRLRAVLRGENNLY